MISVGEADRIINSVGIDLQTETVPFDKAIGRVLAEDIGADRDFPPFNRVSMDGIAIDFESFKNGRRAFKIQAIQAAGSPQLTLNSADDCIEVMTGASAPVNTNTVIRYEDLNISDGVATIQIEDVREFQNNHLQGMDRKQGDVIVPKNTKITSAEVGILTSVGRTEVSVHQNPSIAIVSTGEELVDVADTPEPHQIRKSNVHTVHAALMSKGLNAELYHLPDHRESIQTKLEEIFEKHQIVILSGGVSKGKYDYLPEAFEKLGVEKLFHKIQQRPGKPFWFGKRADKNVVFAFPGNPVSTFMCFQRYFIPWIGKQMFQETKQQFAILQSDFNFKPPLQYFLQAKVSYSEGNILATPIVGHGSGDLANLILADAFLELPADRNEFKAGETFPIHLYR